MEFYKVAWDDGPWYGLANLPVGKTDSVCLTHWRDNSCEMTQDQLIYAHKVSNQLNVALNVEFWGGNDDRQDVVVDWHPKGKFGLGLWVPLQEDKEAKIGPSYKLGRFTGFATLGTEGRCRVYGISRSLEKGGQIDLANDPKADIWWLRASVKQGKFFPELRLKKTSSETFVGFAVGYAP
jgi:hypothetical protein